MKEWLGVLEEIKAAKEELLTHGDDVWFRGQQNVDWNLTPSLLRYSNGVSRERELFNKFDRHASVAVKPKESSWETLFDMQHYYIPTRLLDWTEVLGVALYFAMLVDTDSPCIWLLSPQLLNSKSGKSEVRRCDEKDFDYKRIFWDKHPFAAPNPIAIEPPLRNDRINAQKGMFTIHGEDERGVDEIHPDCLRKVAIPKDAIEAAREYLEFADINEFSLFPDVTGLAPFLNRIAGLE